MDYQAYIIVVVTEFMLKCNENQLKLKTEHSLFLKTENKFIKSKGKYFSKNKAKTIPHQNRTRQKESFGFS